MKNTKNKTVVLVALMLMLARPMQAQIFIMDDEFESNIRVGESEFVVPAPYQGGDLDQYLPLGDGLLLLAGLGGAYLLGKRKKEQK
jgi:hypothetical protein